MEPVCGSYVAHSFGVPPDCEPRPAQVGRCPLSAAVLQASVDHTITSRCGYESQKSDRAPAAQRAKDQSQRPKNQSQKAQKSTPPQNPKRSKPKAQKSSQKARKLKGRRKKPAKKATKRWQKRWEMPTAVPPGHGRWQLPGKRPKGPRASQEARGRHPKGPKIEGYPMPGNPRAAGWGIPPPAGKRPVAPRRKIPFADCNALST